MMSYDDEKIVKNDKFMIKREVRVMKFMRARDVRTRMDESIKLSEYKCKIKVN